MKTQKKSSKNAVTAGVLIALYFVTYLVIGAISMPVPVLFLLMPMLVALLAAPTYHMLLAKTKSATAIVIAAILPSILLVATGHIPIAPLVARGGNYTDFKKNTISHMFFSLNLFGGFLPIWLMREAFFESVIKGGLDQNFCNTVRAWTPIWMLPVMIIGTFIFSLIGSYFTKKILNKKLESAGVL